LIRAAVLLILVFGAISSPAAAMNWCSLPQIVPRTGADFEKLLPSIGPLTGCAREPSDSAHKATWSCPDDPTTADVFEGAMIFLNREPGADAHLIVLTLDRTNLDVLRGCGIVGMRDGEKFAAGNVALRDRVTMGYAGPRLTLTSVIPEGVAAIISDTKYVSEDPMVEGMWTGLHGIVVETSPWTSVRLAGQNPLTSKATAIVSAFESRGSKILSTDDAGKTIPTWKLSPPVGLAGVSEVSITGFVEHFLRAEYVMGTTSDYERFVGLLDAEYGKSTRTPKGACTYRWWESGRMTIMGEHCPGKSDLLRFTSITAADQLQQVLEKIEADEAKSGKPNAKPTIDGDML
jgi:hypothetical protein